MRDSFFIRAIITWLLFIPIAFLNGTLRQIGYQKFVGKLPAHQISTITGSAAFLVLSFYMMRHQVADLATGKLLLIGLIWLLLTTIFEFGLGLATGRSWQYMLADYNLSRGKIWPLLLLVVFFAPIIIKSTISK